MQTGRLILLLLLVLVVAVVVMLLVRRSAARKEQQRVEAAALRTDADAIAARLAGQDTYAQQAAERAEVARVEAEQRAREAEERAREAARLEDEAAEQRAAAESARREYEQTMRRADDLDPDVRESSFPPVEAAEEPTSDRGAGAAGALAGGSAGAAGAALWGARDGERHPDSERIASAADYRDDEPAAGRGDDVSAGQPVGRPGDMSDDARLDRDDLGNEGRGEVPATSLDSDASHDAAPAGSPDVSRDVESPRGEWGGPRQEDAAGRGEDDGADLAVIADPEAYAATEPVLAADQTQPVEREPRADQDQQWSSSGAADQGADAGADHGADAVAAADHGADAGADPLAGTAGSHDVGIVADTDRYAATEPVSATEGGALTEDAALAADRGADGDRTPGADDRSWSTPSTGAASTSDRVDPDQHAPAETGAAVAENDPTTGTAADDAERASRTGGSTAATTPQAHDWAAEEGELLEQTHDRGDRLAEERHELAREAGTSTGEDVAQRAARRITDFHELRDGGYGVGSAAPLEDGAQPLDHPVQGHRGSMTFHVPGDPGYDTAEPDVWFYDEGAAERAGFRRSGR